MKGIDLDAGMVTCGSCGETAPLPGGAGHRLLIALPFMWADGSIDGSALVPLCPDCRHYEPGPWISFRLGPARRIG